MQSSFVPNRHYLRRVAQELGLNADRLLIDMNSAAVSDRLRDSRALARIFGFFGTPAMVVGRTLVLGRLPEKEFDALIAREREDGPVPFCG